MSEDEMADLRARVDELRTVVRDFRASVTTELSDQRRAFVELRGELEAVREVQGEHGALLMLLAESAAAQREILLRI